MKLPWTRQESAAAKADFSAFAASGRVGNFARPLARKDQWRQVAAFASNARKAKPKGNEARRSSADRREVDGRWV
jgi:hypothetical protein